MRPSLTAYAFDRARGVQQGSIMVYCMFFILLCSGLLLASLYVGKITTRKIQLHNSVDIAANAMAEHAASGLNMMAINNIGIAASLHAATAAPLVARYYALAQALTRKNSAEDISDLIALYAASSGQADTSRFAALYGPMRVIAGHFTQTASGLTVANRTIQNHWLVGAVPRAIESYRLNMPGSLGYPYQRSAWGAAQGGRLAAGASSSHQGLQMKYAGLKETTPRNALCHALAASSGLPSSLRDRPTAWLRPPLTALLNLATQPGARPQSAELKASLQQLLQQLDVLEQGLQGEKVNIQALMQSAARLAPLADGLVTLEKKLCRKDRAACQRFKNLKKQMHQLAGWDLPRFKGCGLTAQGDFGSMMQQVMSSKKTHQKLPLGFIYPDRAGSSRQAENQAFTDSVTFGVMLGAPLWTSRHFQNAGAECPTGWSFEAFGTTFCDVSRRGFDLGQLMQASSAEPALANIVSGGIRQIFGELPVRSPKESGAEPSSTLQLMQWSVGEARAVYDPEPQDPQDAVAFGEKDERRMQLFWPAWRAKNIEPKRINIHEER
jgi:hypothetical protein